MHQLRKNGTYRLIDPKTWRAGVYRPFKDTGLKKFDTDLKTKTVTITYDADKTDIEKLKEGFRKFHYEAEFVKESKQGDKK